MLLHLLHFLLEDKKKNLFYIIIIILFNSKMHYELKTHENLVK